MKKKIDWTALRERLQEPSLSILLALQMLLVFVVAPINESIGGYRWMVDIPLVAMSYISVIIVRRPAARRIVLASFALSTLGLFAGRLIANHLWHETVLTLSHVLFNLTVSVIIAHKMLKDGPVTMHRIRGAIAIYLNIAILFAMVGSYLLALDPHAYNLNGQASSLGSMIYFSLTTLTSTGYGDIVPLNPLARSLANLEAVVGQFYLGTLIAILVSLHVSERQRQREDVRGPR